LYRSAALHDLGPDETRVVRDVLGIRCVIDLRTPEEVVAHGQVTAAAWGARCVSLPVLTPPLPDAGGPADLASRYFAYLATSTPSVIAAFRQIARQSRMPVAIHCTSGKDRTGVVSGLLLRLIGVTGAAIAEDYALTAPNMPRVMERLGRGPDRSIDWVMIPPGILRAEAHTIRSFLDTFEERYGSVRKWALDRGLGTEEIGGLTANLVD
jgi:hypothetical protein